MKTDSVMANLYFGRYDAARTRYRETGMDDPAVAKLVASFSAISKEYPPEQLEALGKAPDGLFKALAAAGFFGLDIPKEYGGLGLNLHQYLKVIESAAAVDMTVAVIALAHLSIGMKGILLFGTEEQKRKYLPKAADGSMIFAYALTEPLIGSDARQVSSWAAPSADGNSFILNGTKTLITNANYAGCFTVFARMGKDNPGKLGAFIVESSREGVTVGKDMAKMGLKASSTAYIKFDNVVVPKADMLGTEGDGFKIAMTILDYGRLSLGAGSSGLLEVSAADMEKRASSREQFGKPVIEYELIREKIINAKMKAHAVRAITNFTASLLADDPAADASIETSHTKFYGTESAWAAVYDAMQVAGGSGYLATQPYEKRMRDFRVATIFEGTSEIHSIYPPLALARSAAKELKGKGFFGKALFFALSFLAPTRWKAGPGFPGISGAVRAAKSGAVIYRKLFLRSILKYGGGLPDHEYLLRRLTGISCAVLALIAMIERIRYLRRNGMDDREARWALDLFTSKTPAIFKENNRLLPNKTEKIGNMFPTARTVSNRR